MSIDENGAGPATPGPEGAGPEGAGPDAAASSGALAGAPVSDAKRQVMRELRDALFDYQRAANAFDDAVSEWLDLNRTDLRCLDLLERHHPMTAGSLAEASGITTGAMTFVLDRLESTGFVRRRRDDGDRRRVLVELEPDGARRALSAHAPLVAAARDAASRFDLAELDAARRILAAISTVYDRHSAVLRSGAHRAPAGREPRVETGEPDRRPGPSRTPRRT